jgi:hypothetical protein
VIGFVRGHRRAALYAALALAIPLPAFALTGEDAGDAPAGLDVSASLVGCGLAKSHIVCTIDATYGPVEGATSYSASVTAPNGAVTDYGAVEPGAAALTVPYAGNGTYSVRITAYGDPPGPAETGVIDTATSDEAGGEANIEVRGARGEAPEERDDEAAPQAPAVDGGEIAPAATTPEAAAPAAPAAAGPAPAPQTGGGEAPAPAPTDPCAEEPPTEPALDEAPAPEEGKADGEPTASTVEASAAETERDPLTDCEPTP